MGGINTSRWILGGVVAGVVLWLLEGLASVLYRADMETALTAHGLEMELTAPMFALSVAVSLLVGLTLVFFYAVARSRFGPGPMTAVKVAFVLFVGGYFVSLLGYFMIGLFPNGLLIRWGLIGLGEMVVASLVGGWLYREA